jgi:hypothetical protein
MSTTSPYLSKSGKRSSAVVPAEKPTRKNMGKERDEPRIQRISENERSEARRREAGEGNSRKVMLRTRRE